jgi:hypothetical protein
MDAGIEGTLIGISVGVVLNIVMVAFTYGKLVQRVCDNERRLDRLEKIVNHKE